MAGGIAGQFGGVAHPGQIVGLSGAQGGPQIPKSEWWFTDASFVGFRVVSPIKQPTKAEMEAYFKLPPDNL